MLRPFTLRIVLLFSATAALLAVTAGPAAAQPLRRPPQVNGVQLQAALLPPAAFGAGFMFSSSLNTGRRLQSTRATRHVPSLSCGNFENEIYVGFLGQTAGAEQGYSNPSARTDYPVAAIAGYEDVNQFGGTAAANALFTQDQAKYTACQSFTFTNSGTTFQGATVSVSGTTVSGYRAFVVADSLTATNILPLYFNFLYVVAGTNLYSMGEISGQMQEPSSDLMSELIRRIQALYRHHH